MIIINRKGNETTSTIKPDPTWEEVFADVPVAQNTEAAQARHQELRLKEDLITEEEEEELNDLFFTIYPQLKQENNQ